MRKRYFILLLLCALIFAGIFFIIIGKLSKRSLISFESDPEAEVYIDNEKIGTTPIEFETNKENILISLKVLGAGTSYLPYETALSLTPHTKVIVRHKFSMPVGTSTSQIFEFIDTHENAALATVIANPVNSNVFIDNSLVGTTPLRLSPPEGAHSIKIVKDGFKEFSTHIQTKVGLNLTLDVTLARDIPIADVKSSQSKQIATILNTDYGYVSVHKSEKDTTEISRATADHEYEVLGFNESKSSVEIRLNASESGWVSSKYVSIR